MDSGDKPNELKMRSKRRRYNLTASAANIITSNGGRRPTYAQWIAKAVASAPNRAMTLADINDWMIKNVPGLEEQRYLHSCKGWKNAVRHTLSINRHRFRKVPQSGKPSFWCLNEPEDPSIPFCNNACLDVTQPTSSPTDRNLTGATVEDRLKKELTSTSAFNNSDSTANSNVVVESTSVYNSIVNSPDCVTKAYQRSAVGGFKSNGLTTSPLHNFVQSVEVNCGKLASNHYGSPNGAVSISVARSAPNVLGLSVGGAVVTAPPPTIHATSVTPTVQQLDVLCQDGTVKKLYLPSPLPLTDMNLRILCSSFVPDVSTQTLLWSHLNRTLVNDSLTAAAAISLRNAYNINDIMKGGSANFIV